MDATPSGDTWQQSDDYIAGYQRRNSSIQVLSNNLQLEKAEKTAGGGKCGVNSAMDSFAIALFAIALNPLQNFVELFDGGHRFVHLLQQFLHIFFAELLAFHVAPMHLGVGPAKRKFLRQTHEPAFVSAQVHVLFSTGSAGAGS